MRKWWNNIGAWFIALGFLIFISALWKGPVHLASGDQISEYDNAFALISKLRSDRQISYDPLFDLPEDLDLLIHPLDGTSYQLPEENTHWDERQRLALAEHTSWMVSANYSTTEEMREVLSAKLDEINAHHSKAYQRATKWMAKEEVLMAFRGQQSSLSNMFLTSLILVILGSILYSFIPHWRMSKGIHHNGVFRSGTGPKLFAYILGASLVIFYIVLYWFSEYIGAWVVMMDPISYQLSGHPATEWFLYGFLYTLVMLVMGIRMYLKYRGDRYQMIRTTSILFFQLCFAFILPEIMVRLNQPYQDLKNIWPLDYDLFFSWNMRDLIDAGQFGIFILVWGIILAVVAVPILVYFFGKRWYCSWVCGCGGLAETLGDPFRQLSSKSLRSWKIERWSVHSVLVIAIIMTILSLISFFTTSDHIMGLHVSGIQKWYGFLIGSIFAGVVGTGFYPLMGNRVWCRFGCPLAAYMGLIQRFRSRFRISTNGGQCISCGNCSTYCEMGIDVRIYAQRGQDIVRASCVGCGVCASVCPRGVLKLENGNPDDRWDWHTYSVGNEGLRAHGKK